MDQEQRRQIREEKAKRQKKRRKVIIKIFIALIIIIVLVILSLTVFFKMDKIALKGDSIYSEKEIAEASGIQKGENLFLINKTAAKRNIESKYPDIGDISVSIRLPNQIIIEDKGYSELFALKSEDGYIIIDKDKILRRRSKSLPDNIVLVKGIEFEESNLYSKISLKNDNYFDSVISLSSALYENGLTKVISISVESLDNIHIMYDNRIDIALGGLTNINEKLQRAKYILELEENQDVTDKILDLTVSDTAYFK